MSRATLLLRTPLAALLVPALALPVSGRVQGPGGAASAPAKTSAEAAFTAPEWPAEIDADRVPTLRTGGNVLIENATILPVSSPMIERGSILVRGGKIAAIGERLSAPEGTVVIDGRGLFVAPGSVDCHSHLAIHGSVNEMTDSITAECRIADVIDPDDLSIYRALAGGSTVNRLLHGSANPIGGEHAVVKLKWKRTAAELLMVDAPRGIKFALGENPKRSSSSRQDGPSRYPASRMGVEAVIRRAFGEARDLLARQKSDLERIGRGEKVAPRRQDLRLGTIAAIVAGEVAIHSHCYRADEIQMLLELAESFGVQVKTLQHVLEGYIVAPEIARHGAGASTFSDWWAYKAEAYDATPYNAALMARAGVNVSLNSDSAELVRRLHLDSGKTIRYGMLAPDEALAMVTLNPAHQLGIAARVGSLEVGKDADLAIFDGHPLACSSKCVWSLVDGEVEFQRRDAWTEYLAALPAAPARESRRSSWAATTPWSPAPKIAPPPFERIAIVRGTVVPVDGPVVENGTVLVENGVITALGAGLPAPAGAAVIDATGLFVYPGLLDGGSPVGLAEIGQVSATVDRGEGAARWQPDILASRALSARSEHIAVARANGVTTVLVPPSGGTIQGQSSLVHLDGWTPAEMLVADPLALHASFPSQSSWDSQKSDADNEKEREKVYGTSTRELKEGFERAAAWGRGPRTGPRDPRVAALAPYALGERPVIFSVGSAVEAVAAVRFSEENGLRPILRMDAGEAGRVAAFLAKKDVPVLLGAVTSLPRSVWDPYDTAYSAPRLLQAAGVRFGFALGDSSNLRNLPFQAGIAVAFGLSPEAALRSVTLSTAEILGVDEKLGSIAVGKIADLIVTDGSPLEVRTHVKHAVIGGRRVDLSSRHTRLYEQYLQRLSPEQRAAAGPAR